MPKKAVDKKENIEQKLDYLGLDLDFIPEKFKKSKPLEFRVPKVYSEKQYKQYRYVPIKDIQILLSPTNRLDEIEKRYKKASPLADYLDSENQENILKYTTFLNMLRHFKIEDVKKVEEEQEMLNKKIPFRVKFQGNYLWQIYYSENTDTYFMLVPTEDSDYSTFFYLLKKQLDDSLSEDEEIFVPIRNVEYSNEFYKKSQFEEISNYMWLFTKDWPLIYEVYDKKEQLSIRIVGETEVYGKIKSQYRIKLDNKDEATKFYKLLKAMFILQKELPNYFQFRTDIFKTGGIDFYFEDKNITYEQIPSWINDEYNLGIEKIKQAEDLLDKNTKKLDVLKSEVAVQEIEYLAKEKQISTFLECKKSFFGKVKYYFKYSKKGKKSAKDSMKDEEQENNISELSNNSNREKVRVRKSNKVIPKKDNYTIEELIELYKEYEVYENKLKKLLMDINSLKLKKKNMQKKIENATNFIEEIDSHKRSIFEFWRYSNKDEMESLPEGEEEEVNIIKKVTKVFDYEQDMEKFGALMDKTQRKSLSKEETDSIFIATTDLLELLNKVKNNEVLPREIESSLKEIRKEARQNDVLKEDEFDFFGGMDKENSTGISEINDKKHRELPKDKISILDINKNTKTIGYKLTLEGIVDNIKKALNKVVVTEDIPVYLALNDEKLNKKNLNVFDINPESEMKKALEKSNGKINFYKINLSRGTNAISYTNCIFYDNQNKTLPIGQDLSTNILVDVSKLKLIPKMKSAFKIIKYDDDSDDFSKLTLKSVNVYEYDLKENE